MSNENIKPNCVKAILTAYYPLGLKRDYVHYSRNRWTVALWAMVKTAKILYPFPFRKTHWVRLELETRPCKVIRL